MLVKVRLLNGAEQWIGYNVAFSTIADGTLHDNQDSPNSSGRDASRQ
jgi:hypothetical protein